jgi:hypothetical protein
MVRQLQLQGLETRYDGSNGLPAFTREEYDDYITRHPQYASYDLEDVYKKMYEPELDDYKLRNAGKPGAHITKPSTTIKPTRTVVREEQLTPEEIERRLSSMPEAERMKFYDANKDKIDSALGRSAISSD